MRIVKLIFLFLACLVSASYAQTAAPAVSKPDAPSVVDFKEAMAQEKSLKWEEAIAQFDQIIQKYPGTPEARKARIEIGRYYKYQRDWQRAVEEYRHVIAEAPRTREAHDAMTAEAVVHWFRNDFRRSRDLFEAVLQETTDWDQIKYCGYWFRELHRRIAFEDRQQFTCGPKSLRIALNKLGIETEDTQIAQFFRTEDGQVSMSELVQVASAKGVTPKVVKVHGDGVLDLDTPFIASVQPEHYVVVTETGDNRITYIDPSNEAYTQTKSLTEFSKDFRGYALVFLNDRKYAALRLPSVRDDELHEVRGGVCWCCALGNLGHSVNADVASLSQCPTRFGMPGWSMNTVTMNLIVEDIDVSYTSRGMPVALVRTYNADDPKDGPFGRSWTFNFNISLTENADVSIDIRRGDGRIDHYFWNGTKYQGPEAVYDTVVKNGDGTYTMTMSGSRMIYHFSAAGILQSIVARNGNRITLSYDANGRLVTITDPNGKNTTLTYGANNKISKVTAPDGRFATYFYDAYNNLIQSTDMVGATSAYGYDGSSYMTSITTPQTGTTTFTYSANHLGRALDTMTDALGNKTKFTYVSSRNIRITDAKGNGTLYVSTYEGYTESITSAAGNKVTYEYDSPGNVVKVKDTLGNAVTLTYDGSGHPLTITDPLNNKVTLVYDAEGNPVSATDARGKAHTFAYDEKFNLLSAKDPLNAVTGFTYNSFGQVIRLTDARGGVTDFTYDAEGKLTQMKDPLGKITTYTNDLLGRTTALTDPKGQTFGYQYDGVDHLIKITNPDATTSNFLYNCCHLLQAQDASGILQFTYDAIGRMTQFKNQDNKTIGYKYDSVGHLIELTYPDGKKVTYEYDADNRLVKVKDWLGNETTYVYDTRGNLATAVSPGLITVYFYDVAGRLTKLINYNRATMAITSGFAYTLDANANRNVIKKVMPLANAAFQQEPMEPYSGGGESIQQWAAGATASSQYSSGSWSAAQAMGAANVAACSDNGNAWCPSTSGTNAEWLLLTYETPVYATGVSIHETYNAPCVTKIEYLEVDGTAHTVWQGTDGTACNGYLTTSHAQTAYLVKQVRITTQKSGWEEIDAARLDGITQPGPTQAVYYNYNADNQLTAATGRTFSYDNNGNMVSIAGSNPATLAYDRLNRLTQYTAGGTAMSFQYDVLGNRIAKTANSVTTKYIGGLVETNASGAITAYYVYGLGLISKIEGSSAYFYQYDGLGSTAAITDATGAIKNKYAYDDFGQLATNSSETIANPFKYVGKYGVQTDANDLLYMRARYYMPSIGRFINKDPIGLAGGVNRYGYTRNNPVNFIDPRGLFTIPFSDLNGGGTVQLPFPAGTYDLSDLGIPFRIKVPRSGTTIDLNYECSSSGLGLRSMTTSDVYILDVLGPIDVYISFFEYFFSSGDYVAEGNIFGIPILVTGNRSNGGQKIRLRF